MTTEFPCPWCERRFQLTPEVAGRRVSCTDCGHHFDAPVLDWPVEPPRRWYLRLVSGRLFGPVDRETVEQWIREERAGPGCLVAHEGAGSWMPLEREFAALCEALGHAHDGDACAPGPTALDDLPDHGWLDRLVDERALLPSEERRRHASLEARLVKECQRSAFGLAWGGAKSIRLRTRPEYDAPTRGLIRLEARSALVASLRWMEQDFGIVVPWSPLGVMAHEFFSILPGALPDALALRRLEADKFGGGLWLGPTGTAVDPLATAARAAQDSLANGLNWRWITADGNYEMTLVWGLQAVPLGPRRHLHILQTSPLGTLRRSFGLDWYLQRQQAFTAFRDGLSLPGAHGPHFLFSCSTGRVIDQVLSGGGGLA